MLAAQQDKRITAEREELKFLLPKAAVRPFVAAVARAIPDHAYRGADANVLPGAEHHVTTVYFDTEARDIYKEAIACSKDVKIRAKEYYDDHPDLTEVATQAEQLIRYTPVIWLEVKRRDGSKTRKLRFGLPKRDVPVFFAADEDNTLLDIAERTHGVAAKDVVAEMQGLRERFDRPLRPDCLVNYRRRAWQSLDGSLRITMDRNLAVYAPAPDLWTRSSALTRETLGTRRGRLPLQVVEVKSLRAWPQWLTDALANCPPACLPDLPECRFSKFTFASRTLHE